ncbi:unnamed protein product, partial [Lymnaea stagnalis]
RTLEDKTHFIVNHTQQVDMHKRTTISHCGYLRLLIKRFTSHRICCVAALATIVGSLFVITAHTNLNHLLRNRCSALLHVNQAWERESSVRENPNPVHENA